MSREILFRGRTKKGKWVKGDLFHGRCFVAINDRELELIPPQMIEVDPDTVCQYTGLKDKNGVKIFEGDIVRSYEGTFVVKYQDAQACFMLEEIGIDVLVYLSRYSMMGEFEVIGNVFDDPEILKDAAQYADQDGLMPAT